MFHSWCSEFSLFISYYIIEMFSFYWLTPHLECIRIFYCITQSFEFIFYIISLPGTKNFTKTHNIRILWQNRINHRINMSTTIFIYFFWWLWDEKLPRPLSGISSTIIESCGYILKLYGDLVWWHNIICYYAFIVTYIKFLCKYLLIFFQYKLSLKY